MGVQSGLGYRLLDFRYLLRDNDMLVFIVVIGGIGIATDYFVALEAQNRVSRSAIMFRLDKYTP